MKQNILLVEDDLSLVKGLHYALTKEDFKVHSAVSLEEAREILNRNEIEMILLDVNLPDGSGFELCREIRRDSAVPIIFLTACDEEVNIVMGLDLGADDYVAKPFRINELISRIHAVLRRSGSKEKSKDMLKFGAITLDRKSSRVLKSGSDIQLTVTEFRLVGILLENRGQVVTRDRLIELLWDREEHYIDSNTLSVYIRRLREKLEDNPADPDYIETVRGLGYRWL